MKDVGEVSSDHVTLTAEDELNQAGVSVNPLQAFKPPHDFFLI